MQASSHFPNPKRRLATAHFFSVSPLVSSLFLWSSRFGAIATARFFSDSPALGSVSEQASPTSQTLSSLP